MPVPCMTINYWETNNSSPVVSFMQGEPAGAGSTMQRWIDFFEQTGMALLNTPYLKKIQGYKELYELRVKWKGFAYRIMMVVRGSVAWLVHAFRKTTEKTPLHEIKLAVQRQALIPNLAI